MSFENQSRPAPEGERPVPDMSALDAALRDVIAAARVELSVSPAPMDELDQEADRINATLDTVTRAATTIDQLVERNRALTDAAVRSVDFLRQDAAQARAEADALRAENEALKAAALAHADELEAELAARTRELDAARSWIADLRAHVETLLGNVETRLAETKVDSLFEER